MPTLFLCTLCCRTCRAKPYLDSLAMDRYQRVEKPRNETPIRENEIRITALGRMRNYIGYGMSLLEVIPLLCFIISLCSYLVFNKQ